MDEFKFDNHDFDVNFQIESYLQHQGSRFLERFDANSYLYITRAMDYFDLETQYGSLKNAFSGVKSKMLFLSISSDWLFTTEEMKKIVISILNSKGNASLNEIQSPYGHDGFLIKNKDIDSNIEEFLNC